MPSPIFSAHTFPPHPRDDAEFKERYDKILQVSRERYCKKRDIVEQKIQALMDELEKEEDEWEKKKEDFKKQKDEEKKSEREKKQEKN